MACCSTMALCTPCVARRTRWPRDLSICARLRKGSTSPCVPTIRNTMRSDGRGSSLFRTTSRCKSQHAPSKLMSDDSRLYGFSPK
eukprot:2001146-Pleurochrysis_carterae.AAC.1